MTTHLTRIHDLPKHAEHDTTGWSTRHLAALNAPRDAEVAIVGLLEAWLIYADRHQDRYMSDIGEDGVLGPEWAKVGSALLALLNGELGRLDGGTLDTLIRDTLVLEGYNPDDL